jgi:hypothetical protein
MLPPSHIAYTWLALTVAQDAWRMAPEPTTGWWRWRRPARIWVDKPLAAAYFYRRYKSAVLFAHTLLANLAVLWLTIGALPHLWVYAAAWLGHACSTALVLSRHLLLAAARVALSRVGQARLGTGEIGKAYWVAFTRRPELWGWELGGLLALVDLRPALALVSLGQFAHFS